MIPVSRRSRARWIALLCALAAIPVAVLGINQGVRHVRETWAIEALRSSKPAEREAALRKLGELRSVRGVLEILSSMTSAETAMRLDLREWEDLCGRALGEIGTAAVPVLLSRIDSSKRRERVYAVRFLWRAPELARERQGPALLHLLGDSDPAMRDEAAAALGFLARSDPLLLETLVDELKRMDRTEDRRVAAARTLGITSASGQMQESQVGGAPTPDDLGPERTESVRRAARALVETLDDPSSRVREACLRELCAILGHTAPTHADIQGRLQGILRRWLTGADTGTRSLALDWLHGAFPARPAPWMPPQVSLQKGVKIDLPQDVLSILATLLGDADSGVRSRSARYLGRAEAVPLLMDVLDRSDPVASLEALRVLASLSGVEAWSAVFDVLERPDGSVRPVAVDLLLSMGEREGIGVIRLSQAVESRGSEVRRAAARVLARYHASGSLGAHGLFALLHDEDEAVLVEAAAALASSGNLDVDCFQARVLKLIDPSNPPAVREAACRAAAGLGPRAESAVPRLVALLEGEPRDAREAAAAALGAIGPAAGAGIPALIAAAEGSEVDVAAKAIEALARISPGDAIAPAVRALAHESGRLRDAAQAALWSLGSDARQALPALRKLAAQEKDLDLATRATTLVGRLEAALEGSK